MIRGDFDRESDIIGKDFAKLLHDYGGKTAGLELQRALIRQCGLGAVIGAPPYYSISREPYEMFEEVVNSRGGLAVFGDNHWSEPEKFEKKVLTPKLRAEIVAVINEMLRTFQQRGIRVGLDTLFHVRLSVDLEDFVDDRYWGVFGTHAGIPLFRGFTFSKGKVSFAMRAIIALFAQLYWVKQQPAYCLPGDVGGGVTVQLTADAGRYGGLAVIAYSGYPETEHKEAGTAWEVYRVQRGTQFQSELGWAGSRPFGFLHYQLFMGRSGMVPGYYLEPDKMGPKRSWFWYWEGVRELQEGYLTGRQTYLLSKILEEFARILDYQVNLELWTLGPRDDFFHSVQLRPVPILDSARPVKKLEPLNPGEVLLAETPFVFGSFRVTSPLVMPQDRYGYTQCHIFEQPVIICYERGRDIMGFAEMPNVAAVLNLLEGRALSHGQECKPSFPEREEFRYLGVPMLHGLENYFGPKQEFMDSVTTYGLRFTPFSVTVESDGRFGRVYMKAEDAKRFGVKPAV